MVYYVSHCYQGNQEVRKTVIIQNNHSFRFI